MMRAAAQFGLTFAVAGALRYFDQPLWLAVTIGLIVGILLPILLQQWLQSRQR